MWVDQLQHFTSKTLWHPQRREIQLFSALSNWTTLKSYRNCLQQPSKYVGVHCINTFMQTHFLVDGYVFNADILGDPYSKKSTWPNIGELPLSGRRSKDKDYRWPSTWPAKNTTTETYHLLQPSKNRCTTETEARNSRDNLLACISL